MALRTLQSVLESVNSLGDFASRPAKSASDRGAYDDYPIHKVAIWGDVEAAKVLLANGADINAAGEDSDTPLHRAVAGGSAAMIRFLVSSGANVNVPDRYGVSPLQAAEMSGNQDLLRAMTAAPDAHDAR